VDKTDHLIASLLLVSADATPVLDYLLIGTPEHSAAGIELQQTMIDTEDLLRKGVDKLWPTDPKAPAPEPPKQARPVKPVVGEWRGGNGFLGC
jgi:hypothetical protein